MSFLTARKQYIFQDFFDSSSEALRKNHCFSEADPKVI
jgi:hypothetical protein